MSDKRKICSELRMTNNAMAAFINKHAHSHADMSDVTILHGRIIKYLCDNAGRDVFQRDIEDILAIRRSTATTILKCMEKNGLITRASVLSDARLKKICLTDRARSIHGFISREMDSMEDLSRRGLSDEEIECFLDVLRKIRNNFNGN